jgi:cell fate regulator YaaT (PSP1 superfamily)
VRLRRRCNVYDFDAGDLELVPGDWVIADTARGQDVGQIVAPPREVSTEDLRNDLKPIIRMAHPSDLERMKRSHEQEAEALERAQDKVDSLGLPMRLISAEYTYNRRSLTIYFTAEKRVDFRELVRKLARSLRTRIELRQVGARDEARLLGGIGPCGRLLCCDTFLCDFQRISVRMAKAQDLPLNPMKISGVCGRLLCCLSYEYDQYKAIKKLLPSVGDEVVTMRGKGKVTGLLIPKEAALVEVRPGLMVEATLDELAQAAELEAKGELAPVRASYIEIAAQSISAPQQTASGSKKKRRRRRRKKPSSDTTKKGDPSHGSSSSQAKSGRQESKERTSPSSKRKGRRRSRRRRKKTSSDGNK